MNLREKHKWLIIAAKVAVAEYPQYRGAFDDNVLVKIKGDLLTKGGLAFQDGEYAIMKPGVPERLPSMGGLFRSVWSASNRCHVSVPMALVHTIPREEYA